MCVYYLDLMVSAFLDLVTDISFGTCAKSQVVGDRGCEARQMRMRWACKQVLDAPAFGRSFTALTRQWKTFPRSGTIAEHRTSRAITASPSQLLETAELPELMHCRTTPKPGLISVSYRSCLSLQPLRCPLVVLEEVTGLFPYLLVIVIKPLFLFRSQY